MCLVTNLPIPLECLPTNAPAVDRWFKWSEQVWESTHHQCLEWAAITNKEHADHHWGKLSYYQPRDQVWLATKDLRNTQGCKKLNPRYICRYKILKQVNEVTYILDLPHHSWLATFFLVSCWSPLYKNLRPLTFPHHSTSTTGNWRATRLPYKGLTNNHSLRSNTPSVSVWT